MSVRITFIQRKSTRQRVWKTLNVVVGISTLLNVSMIGALIAPQAARAVGTSLSTQILSWSTIGVDSNDPVTKGPHQFLIQARISNTGATSASAVQTTFAWDAGTPYLSLAPGSSAVMPLNTITAGTSKDVFYVVQVTPPASPNTPSNDVFGKTRPFTITATSTDAPDAPAGQTLTIESILSQSRNSVFSAVVSPASPIVGQQFTVTVVTHTTGGGNFDDVSPIMTYAPSVATMENVTTHYEIPGTTESDIYAQGVGGTMTSVFHFRANQAGSQNFYYLIYDKSGGSYHYNSDFGGAIVVPITPANPNPPLGQSCGLDIGLVVDTSGSVNATEMTQMKTALTSFATAFDGTPTLFSLSSFNTNSTQHQALNRTPAQMASDITNNIPTIGNDNTNWDSGLQRGNATFTPDPRPTKSNLIVIATDGSPNRWGYPVANATFDWILGLNNAIPTANAVKAAGTRIVVVGIGDDETDTSTSAQKLDKMKAISGTNVALTPATITVNTDVIKVADFAGIGDAVAAYAKELCGGKILVQKQFDTNGDGQADVTGNVADPLLGGWSFDVNGTASNPAAQITTNTGAVEFSNILNGDNYSVIETQKANTKLVSAVCTNDNKIVGSVDLQTGTVSGLTMGTDQTISCTFVNGYATGSLKVTKVVNGGTAKPEEFGFRLGNAGGHTYPAASKDFVIFNDLQVGQVTVNETVGALPYHQTASTCTNVNIVAGQQATCIITNARDTGEITFKKVVNNDPTADLSKFAFSTNGQVYHDGDVASINAGTYSLTENAVADYHFVSASGVCSSNDKGEITLNVTSNGGTCTITNARDLGYVKIIKQVVGGDANPLSWSFQAGGTSGVTSGDVVGMPVGDYSLKENNQVAGYVLTDMTGACSLGTSANNRVVVAGAQGIIHVTAQGTQKDPLVCTVTNTHEQGGLTVIKALDTDGDGDIDETNPQAWTWNLDGGNQNYAMGSTQSVLTGNHSATETGPTGYHTDGWICLDSQTQAVVGSGTGMSLSVNVTTHGATCTFTNTRDTGTLDGYKFNDLNGNQTWDQGELGLAGWTIQLSNGASALTDASGHYQFNLVPTGTYTVNEMQQTGWTNTTPLSVSNVEVGYNKTTTINFGNFKLAKISGYKYQDSTNGPKLPNWEICLAGGNQDGDRCTSTNQDGYYEFTGVYPGTYTMYEFMHQGWQAVSPLNGVYGSFEINTSGTELSKDFINTPNVFNVNIEKTSPEVVEAGAQLTYTLTWSVSGNIPVNNVVITDPIGTNANMTFVSASCGTTTGTCSMSNVAGTEMWSLGTRNPGDTGTVTVTVAVASPLVNDTTLSNTAKVCGTGNIPVIVRDDVAVQGEDIAGTEKCDDDTITTKVHSAPIISIVKTGAASVAAGQNLTYTLTWSVTGNSVATNAIVTDAIPANSSFVSSTCGTTAGTCTMSALAGTISWSLGTRNPGETGTVTMTVKAASPIPNGTVLTNTGIFDTTENTPVNSTVTTVILSAPSLSIVKSNNVIGFTNPGKQATYTVTVTNAASATDTAHAVVLTDVLPAGFTYVIGGAATKDFTLGEMLPGASVTTTYTVNISNTQTAGVYTNTATAKGSNTNSVAATSNVEVRVPSVLGVELEPTLVLTKTVDTKVTTPNKIIIYTVAISNPGDLDLTNVKLSDKLPKGFVFSDTGKNTKTWDIGTLKAHRQRVINYPVKITDSVKAGMYDNVATVSSTELDPQSAKATVEVKVPKVLGLATTGASARDYLLFSFGFGLMTIGLYWVARLRRQANGTELA